MTSDRIITITNPGYEVALFMEPNGGAEAVITKPGRDKQPTRIKIAPPAEGKRIVVERKRYLLEVWYRRVP